MKPLKATLSATFTSAIGVDRDAAEYQQIQTRCGDDDVGFSSRPDSNVMPYSVKVSIRSVTTDARPLRIAANISASERRIRCVHGL